MLKKIAIAAAAVAVLAASAQTAEARGPYYGHWGGHYGYWGGGCWGCGVWVPLAAGAVIGGTAAYIASQPNTVIIQQPTYVGPAQSDGPAPNCFSRQYGTSMNGQPLMERVCR